MSDSLIPLTRLARVLAHPVRWKMLAALMDGEPRTTTEFTSLLGTSDSNMSKHLNVLRAAGLVESRHRVNYLAKRFRPAVGKGELDLGGVVIRFDRDWLAGRH